jgi:hypothetical protein
VTLLEAVSAVEDGEADEEEQIAAWQLLHDTGMAYTLQGWYGRTAQALLQQGVIS